MKLKTSDFDFVRAMPLAGGISFVVVLASIFFLAQHGLNYGIDFAGGVEVQVRFDNELTTDEVRAFADELELPNMSVQRLGDGKEFLLRFRQPEDLSDKDLNAWNLETQTRLRGALNDQFGSINPEVRRVDSVGPQVGADLRRNGFLAVLYSLIVILIYVGLRFDYKYAPGAVLCLFHDVAITLGIFVLLEKEVNLQILAVMLTLIGYSLNDTIIVFDRVRETEGVMRDKPISAIVNRAVNDMLGRTVITAVTTFFSSMCLFLFASKTISDLGFAFSIGVVIGTYSSVFVAAPVLILFERWGFSGKPKKELVAS